MASLPTILIGDFLREKTGSVGDASIETGEDISPPGDEIAVTRPKESVDDDPSTGQPGSDYFRHTGAAAPWLGYFELEGFPTDIDSVDTLTYDLYLDLQPTDDTPKWAFQIRDDDLDSGFVNFTDQIEFTTGGRKTGSFTLTTDGENATQSDWSNAVIEVHSSVSRSMGSDWPFEHDLHAFRVSGTYTTTGGGATITAEIYNGTSWVAGTVEVYNGSTWVAASPELYDTTWVT